MAEDAAATGMLTNFLSERGRAVPLLRLQPARADGNALPGVQSGVGPPRRANGGSRQALDRRPRRSGFRGGTFRPDHWSRTGDQPARRGLAPMGSNVALVLGRRRDSGSVPVL